jgi:predicted glutamine amidotransferase
MCRIFAMASEPDLPPSIRSRLLREFFRSTAETYSGGWGVGYFTDEGPVAIKEPTKATDSFALPGAIRRAEPGFIMAHARNPTSGDRSVLNTHPFIKEGWLFSHNGTLGNPHGLRARLLERFSDLQGFTDSEVMFHYILQRMEQAGNSEAGVLAAIREMGKDPDDGTTSLNFAMMDGTVLYVLRKAFKNHDKYTMNYARLDGLELTGGKQALADRGSSTATVVSSEPFTPGAWTGLEMDELLVATADGHRIVKV